LKIKLDENLPEQLADELRAAGHDVHTVHDEGLVGVADERIMNAVCVEGRMLLTQDLDFSDQRKFPFGSHHGIVLIRLRNPSRRKLLERFRSILHDASLETWTNCFVVITDHRIRVRAV